MLRTSSGCFAILFDATRVLLNIEHVLADVKVDVPELRYTAIDAACDFVVLFYTDSNSVMDSPHLRYIFIDVGRKLQCSRRRR